MGRQAYLTKIALGRSAFEPSGIAHQTSEYAQIDPSQAEIPAVARESSVNRYVQLYDERGNPINPRAHEHGRSFREAQNDVLASIGVVERRRSPSQDLPGSYQERLERLEDEDTAGNAIALAGTLVENACTWWIGSLRDRILTFRIHNTIPFARIVASERARSGSTLIYAGFTSRLLNTLSVQATAYAAHVFRPLDRLLMTTRASLRTRLFFRRWKNTSRRCLRLFLEILFYPFAYHATLQRLGLLPARPLLPPWRAFIPFSTSSPLVPFSTSSPLVPFSAHHTRPITSFTDSLKAVVTSPLVFVCLEHFVERWIYAVVYEAVESTVIHPNNPDMAFGDDGSKSRAAILGLRQKSPGLVRNGINKVLVALGWGEPFPSEGTQHPDHQYGTRQGQTIEIGRNQITNLSQLQLPEAQPEAPQIDGEVLSQHLGPSQPPVEVFAPPSPTASEVSQFDNDPRIRITSREGIVEMEVRLPPQIVSTHTEVIDSPPLDRGQHGVAAPLQARDVRGRVHHRVTQLSSEPAQMIGAVCKAQMVGWATFPLKLIRLRLITAHFTASQPTLVPSLDELDGQSIGALISRVALCAALELAVDVSLWACQYIAVTWVGTNWYGWGTL